MVLSITRSTATSHRCNCICQQKAWDGGGRQVHTHPIDNTGAEECSCKSQNWAST